MMNESDLTNENNRYIHPTTLHEVEKRRETSSFPFFCYRLWFGQNGHELVPLHWHNEMELLYTEAQGILYINDQEYPVVPGDIFFINPGLLHHTWRKSSGSMYHIVFDLRLLKNPITENEVSTKIEEWISRKIQVLTCPKQDSRLYDRLLPILRELTEYSETPITTGYEICRIMSLLFSLLSVFYEENCFLHVGENSLYGMDHVTKIMDYIGQNYKSPITVREIAGYMKLSESYIYSLFRDYVGATPVNYINSVRIRESYRLLEDGRNVTETAAEVGFINVSYFIKLFKNATGMTPHHWLKNKNGKL